MESFPGARASLRHEQRLIAAPERVFPLLCPTREYDWIPHWSCTIVHSKSGGAELGCVFTTANPGEGGTDVWVISRHEPPRRIQFVRVNSLRTVRYDITLTALADGTTTALWEQEITGLNDDGNALVAGMTEHDFATMVSKLERLANHYLATGTMLTE